MNFSFPCHLERGDKMDRLGEIRINNQGTKMKIIAYRRRNDMDVEFLDDFHYVKRHSAYSNFVKGTIKNPYDRSVFGIGYIGDGKWKVKHNGKFSRVYLCWMHMIERCYYDKNQELHPSYYDKCTVCNEWLNYQIFADWYKEREYECDGRLHLDKDIKYPGNTVYAPEKCLLVPQRINMLFLNKPNKRGLPNGIRKNSCGYLAKYNQRELGVYNSVEEAYSVYASKKKEDIINIANEYKEIIPDEVYQALLKYEVSIVHDKNYMGMK